MYNSRPRGFGGGFAVPENYSGNAFSEKEKEMTEDSENSQAEEAKETSTVEETPNKSAATVEAVEVGALPREKSRFSLNASRLFRGGIGFEEILIIALILLISQSENNEDVIVLLALLLFIS